MNFWGVIFIFLLLIILFFVVEYAIYHYIFCISKKRRPNYKIIPKNKIYTNCKKVLSKSIQEIESTPSETFQINSFDGFKLFAHFYTLPNSTSDSPIFVFLHGYHGSYFWDGYGTFELCKKLGFRILMIDERNHGASEGNITFGIKERKDCKQWINFIIEKFGPETQIILSGVSMGAASVLMASEMELPKNVKCIISDCGYTSPIEIIKKTVKEMKLPIGPIMSLINFSAKVFGKFNLKSASPLEVVKKNKIPTIFIHGEKDFIVPTEMGKELYENAIAEKKLVLFENASHANNALTDFELYEKEVVAFISKYVKNVLN